MFTTQNPHIFNLFNVRNLVAKRRSNTRPTRDKLTEQRIIDANGLHCIFKWIVSNKCFFVRLNNMDK